MAALATRLTIVAGVLSLTLISAGCSASANNAFFGATNPPRENVLRYVSGSEPESLDPQIPTGQNEARICMALYEGLAEYDPKTGEPIPALAERWEVNKDSSEFVFHLRRDGRFSNGDPITARDFVYTIRRGLTPEVGAPYASMAYPIKYAEAFNSGGVFVFDPNSKTYLLEKDFAEAVEQTTAPADPTRVVLAGDEKTRKKELDTNPKLKAAVAGKQFVPVKADDVGVAAVDDYTLSISLMKPAPFFISMMPHVFFRVLHQKTIETFGNAWTESPNIVTSGPFKLDTWKHYDRINVVRDPMYWDAKSVKLERIVFYLLQDNTTIMNLYKAGELDAMYNHTVPPVWLDVITPLKDFMDAPEAGIDFYLFNTTKAPTSDVRVRKALNMSLNKKALADWRHVKPLTAMTPDGIFPGYPQPKGDPFDPEKAKHLLAEAGYRDATGNFDPKKFAASEVELITNPDGNNLPYAEFIQAQWKQNLGATIPIRVMEAKTFFAAQHKLDYKGVSRTGWAADYMDPFTFLGLFYTPGGNNGTGWWDPKYAALLDEANRTVDHQKRYELLAQAEKLLLEAQPVIPLTAGSTRWLKKPYVKGMYPNAMTLHPWKWIYIERDSAKWDYGMPAMTQ
ncbi:MAG TPA: peptide ABC transporter substrate-binding protein [Pyrinomonadaceae bacterium]|nr:peptide ABC transporter substrate-binding protein [Pyrinomonadaceae bacterium]